MIDGVGQVKPATKWEAAVASARERAPKGIASAVPAVPPTPPAEIRVVKAIGRSAPSRSAPLSMMLRRDVAWLRAGAGPEIDQVVFEFSNDNNNYTSLGSGTRVAGGWELNGASLPAGENFWIRARGRAANGESSSSIIESVKQFYR